MKQETAKKKETTEKGILLDPDRKSPRAAEFEDKLSGWIVGQETGCPPYERPVPDLSGRDE